MRKKIAALLTAAVLTVCLAGCALTERAIPTVIGQDESTPVSPVDPEQVGRQESDPYCYGYLTRRQKEMVHLLYTAAEKMQSGWIELGTGSRTDLALAVYALETDRPELFWLPSSYISGTRVDAQGNESVYIAFARQQDNISYLASRQEKTVMEKELREAVDAIKSQVTATDPYGIELQLHDLLCERITYSDNTTDPMVYTAYGALVNGNAVCEGYARAMQLLLREFEIESTLATGFAGGAGHMWNIVRLEGNWYHLDLTWDDSDPTFVSHEYFNLRDEEILYDRTVNQTYHELPDEELYSGISFNFDLPECRSNALNYFVKTGYVYRPGEEEALAEHIASADRDIIEIWCDPQTPSDAGALVRQINSLLSSRNADRSITGIAVSTFTATLHTTE